VSYGPISPGSHDVVVVNVTVDIHERLGPELRAAAGDARAVVVAGVLVGDQERRTAVAYGRTPSTRLVDGEWAALVLRAP